MNPAGGGPWRSIPAMTAAAADRFGDRPGHRGRDDPADLRRAGARRPAPSAPRWWRRASNPATGWPSGPFNCAEWVVALLGLSQAGAVLVPINTRFKGAEAADILLAEPAPGRW